MTSIRPLARLIVGPLFLLGSHAFAQDAAPPAATPAAAAATAVATPAPPADGKVALKFSAQPGASFVIRRTIIQELDHMLNNAPTHTHAELIMEIQYNIHSTDASGTTTVMATYKRMRHLEKGAMVDIDFDSDAGEPPSRMGPMPTLVHTLKDKSFWFQIDKAGKVLAVKGATEAAQAAFATADVPGGQDGAALMQNLLGQYNDESMLRTVAGMLSNLPPEPKAIGEAWEKTGQEMQMGSSVNATTKGTLVSSDPNVTIVSYTATMTPTTPAPDGPEIAGTRNATYEINTTYGVTQKGTVDMELTGRAVLAMGLSPVKNNLHIVFELLPAKQ